MMPKFSKLIVASIIIMNVIFTIVVLRMFWYIGREPYGLIGAWFAFTTGELWALAKIKQKESEVANAELESIIQKENGKG